MRTISAPSTAPVSELAAFIELAKDPKGYEAKLKALEAARAEHGKAAAKADEAKRAAEAEQAKSAKAAADADAVIAKARESQAKLDQEKQAHSETVRTFQQEAQRMRQDAGKENTALAEREKAVERREIAARAREEKLAKNEAEVAALKTDYESKLAILRKAVA